MRRLAVFLYVYPNGIPPRRGPHSQFCIVAPHPTRFLESGLDRQQFGMSEMEKAMAGLSVAFAKNEIRKAFGAYVCEILGDHRGIWRQNHSPAEANG